MTNKKQNNIEIEGNFARRDEAAAAAQFDQYPLLYTKLNTSVL